MYDADLDLSSIALARYQIFEYRADLDMRVLPPTKDALILHISRGAFIAGWYWGLSHVPDVTNQSPLNWRWKL